MKTFFHAKNAFIASAGIIFAGIFSVFSFVSAQALPTLVVTPSSKTLTGIGQTVQLKATADFGYPTGVIDFTIGAPWVSSNTAVATVDYTGLVTAKAFGSATVGINMGYLIGSSKIDVELPLGGTCSGNPFIAKVNTSVTWGASPTGGNGSYSYVWEGSDGLSGLSSSVTRTYSTEGQKSASVTISSGSQTKLFSCSPIVIGDGIPVSGAGDFSIPLQIPRYDLFSLPITGSVSLPSFGVTTALTNAYYTINNTIHFINDDTYAETGAQASISVSGIKAFPPYYLYSGCAVSYATTTYLDANGNYVSGLTCSQPLTASPTTMVNNIPQQGDFYILGACPVPFQVEYDGYTNVIYCPAPTSSPTSLKVKSGSDFYLSDACKVPHESIYDQNGYSYYGCPNVWWPPFNGLTNVGVKKYEPPVTSGVMSPVSLGPTIPSIIGPLGSITHAAYWAGSPPGEHICPSGTFVYGLELQGGTYVRSDGPPGHIMMRYVYCANSRGVTTDTISQTIQLATQDGTKTKVCAQDEYIKGFHTTPFVADKLNYAIPTAMYCAKLRTPAGSSSYGTYDVSSYSTLNATNNFSAGLGSVNSIVGFTGFSYGGPGNSRGPRYWLNEFHYRPLPPPLPGSLSATQSDYCTDQKPQPTLSWDFSPQSAYQIQISTDPGFGFVGGIIDTGKVSSGSNAYTPPINSMNYGTTYYWRVRAWDNYDAVSEYANSSFTTVPHRGPLAEFKWVPLRPPKNATATFTDISTFYGGSSAKSYVWAFPPIAVPQTPPLADSVEKIKFTEKNVTVIVTMKVTDTDNLTCSTAHELTTIASLVEFKETK